MALGPQILTVLCVATQEGLAHGGSQSRRRHGQAVMHEPAVRFLWEQAPLGVPPRRGTAALLRSAPFLPGHSHDGKEAIAVCALEVPVVGMGAMNVHWESIVSIAHITPAWRIQEGIWQLMEDLVSFPKAANGGKDPALNGTQVLEKILVIYL